MITGRDSRAGFSVFGALMLCYNKDMKNIELHLKEKDKQAISEFKQNILFRFPDANFILFGSKAKYQDSDFSDIDILILLNRKITTRIEEEIFGIGFEVGLQHDVVFGIIVEEDTFWNSPLAKAMPFNWMISKEGIPI